MNNLTVAIENAIGSTSVSLLSSSRELGHKIGDDKSRAESLLFKVFDLLQRNDLELDDVDRIAISLGPGSFTGIKVGMATALGLAKAVDKDCVGVTATEALLELSVGNLPTICAVPIGRDLICTHRFNTEQLETQPPMVQSLEALIQDVREAPSEIIAHHIIAEKLTAISIATVIDAGENLAVLIARRVQRAQVTRPLIPVYASAALEVK